jgi:NAD kinase
MSAQDARILLVHRRTRLEELVARHNTVEQARFAVERLEGDFGDYVKEDARYREALTRAEAALKSLGRVQRLERDFLPNYLFGRDDLVVVVGQDGLVANTLKYLDGQSVLALNPDPTRYEGVLLPFALADLPRVAAEALAGRRPASEITMAEARLNDGQRLQAVNDLFLGPRRHTTASYVLAFGDYRDLQMSSGLIVATGLGSTGWLRSILEGRSFSPRRPGADSIPPSSPRIFAGRVGFCCLPSVSPMREGPEPRVRSSDGSTPRPLCAWSRGWRKRVSSSATVCSTMRSPSTQGHRWRSDWRRGADAC